jgi:mediator of RNA polymerase II transcription subunit 18
VLSLSSLDVAAVLTLSRFKTETVEEMLRFFRDDLEFTLTRHYFTHPINAYQPLATKQQQTVPLSRLPAWEDLTPMDSQRRWVLQVKTHVLQDTRPDEVRRGQESLISVLNELEGVFDFKVIDRKVHDTRAVPPQARPDAAMQKKK